MSARRLENWTQAYLDYTTPTEAPTNFNLWVAIWTIAGALRRRVWIDMGHFQWYPNFYVFFVAPPGVVSKSTTLGNGVKLLEEINTIKFGPEAMTWEALTQALDQAKEEMTFKKDNEIEFIPMSCLNIAAGELGTLINPHNRDMIDALVSLWDGKQGKWEKWTKASGSDSIINPWLNIASCTTPAWIAQNFPEALIGGGFTSRCVFVFEDKKRQLMAYPFMHAGPGQGKLKEDLIHDLGEISKMKGEFKFTKEAIEWGEAWYVEHNRNRPAHLDAERFGGYLARKQTHMHKIAMVHSASYTNELLLTADDLQEGMRLITLTEQSLEKVFENIGIEGAGRHIALIKSYLVRGPVARPALLRAVSKMMSLDEFEAALALGASSEQLMILSQGGQSVIQLHPNRVKEMEKSNELSNLQISESG